MPAPERPTRSSRRFIFSWTATSTFCRSGIARSRASPLRTWQKDELEARTDRSPLIYCNTIHAFCWSLISGFQRQLRERLPQLQHWPERIAEVGDLGERAVEYELGYRGINDRRISIHHDDVLILTIDLMDNVKFRRILADKYPIILIDEYQDTNAGWIDSIKKHFLGTGRIPAIWFLW